MAAPAEEVGQACLEPALWGGYLQAQAESRQSQPGAVGWGRGRLWTPSWGFRGFSSKSHSRPLTGPTVPWDLGCPGSSLSPPWLQGNFTDRLSFRPQHSQAILSSARSHLGRPVLGFKSVPWHPLLRGISPLSPPSGPPCFPCWPTGAMFFIDCQGAEQLPYPQEPGTCLSAPRGYWGKQARREMGLGCDPSLPQQWEETSGLLHL